MAVATIPTNICSTLSVVAGHTMRRMFRLKVGNVNSSGCSALCKSRAPRLASFSSGHNDYSILRETQKARPSSHGSGGRAVH